MLTLPDLPNRILEDAKQNAAVTSSRSRLAPVHEAILFYRAGYFSYERIALALGRHGLKTSPTSVATYCRCNLTSRDIERARRALAESKKPTPPTGQTGGTGNAPAPRASAVGPLDPYRVGRGPKIARDDY